MEELNCTFRSSFILYGHVFGLEHGKCLWTPKYCTCKSAYNNFQGPFNFHNVIRKMFSHMLSLLFIKGATFMQVCTVYICEEKEETMRGCSIYQSPKFYNTVFLFFGLTTLGLLLKLIGWLFRLNVQTFQTLILI